MLLFKDKINYKSAHGNGFAAHLDAPAYDHITPNLPHLTANIVRSPVLPPLPPLTPQAVDPATPANGCLSVVPASHTLPVPLLGGAANGQIEPSWEAAAAWQAVPLDPGDVLFFGSRLAHRSGANASAAPRRMVYATYVPARGGAGLRERYYAHRREWFPPEGEVS